MTLMLLLKIQKYLASSFEEKIFKYFFYRFFLSVAMTTRKMMKSKFCSVPFATHITLMLLINFQNNLASSFGED